MPSAFRRAGAKKTAPGGSGGPTKSTAPIFLKGVKPWAGGIHLTSTGLNDLDSILGGGQPLGTCIFLQEDRWTRDLAMSLVKYWCAEAISQDQDLVIPVSKKDEGDFEAILENLSFTDRYPNEEDVIALLSSLPRNLHWDKEKRKAEALEANAELAAPPSLGILEEEDDDEKNEEKLVVAWQYSKSVQEERSGLGKGNSPANKIGNSSNVFCHSYDLSGRMTEQTEIDPHKYVVDIPSQNDSPFGSAGFQMFRELLSLIKGKEGKAIRLLLFHTDLDALSAALPLFLAHIREQSIPVVVMVCTPPVVSSKSSTAIARASDVVLATEGFASRKEYPPPPEFRHLQGLLKISKVSTVTAATANGGGHYSDMTISKRPSAFLYGFKRDRRKLHIPLLHIPPEDYAAGGGSVGSGVRSGGGKPAESKPKKNSGGMGCSSNMSGSALDF